MIDLKTKKYIQTNLNIQEIIFITKNINITYKNNTGIIFGCFKNQIEHNQKIIIIISIITVIILLIILHKNKNTNNIGYILIISGILGNLLDRLVNKSVIDFIDLHINNYHFPTFNISDISIFIGTNLIIL
ncbi:MAG: lipoprotein signal peptidase [Candidatus Westeberhardia cardiocondylae]|nr:lipoprotein signal peptidase [Candidatus Westeberhardia cardiocondylae]